MLTLIDAQPQIFARLVPRSHTTLTVDLNAFLETLTSLLGGTRGRDGRVWLKANFIAVTRGGRGQADED